MVVVERGAAASRLSRRFSVPPDVSWRDAPVEIILFDEMTIEEHAADGDAAEGDVGAGAIEQENFRGHNFCSWMMLARSSLSRRALRSCCFSALMTIWRGRPVESSHVL